MTSLFTPIADEVTSFYNTTVTKIKGIFVDDVEPALTTFLHVLEANGGAALINLALSVVTAAEAGTPFGALTASLIAAAETQGIQVVEIAAKSALQVAQTHLQAQLVVVPSVDVPPVAVPAPEAPAA